MNEDVVEARSYHLEIGELRSLVLRPRQQQLEVRLDTVGGEAHQRVLSRHRSADRSDERVQCHSFEGGERHLGPVTQASTELVGSALSGDLTLSQDDDPVGQMLGLVHVVGREEDRLSRLAEPVDHDPHLAAGHGIESGRRLVEEEDLGVADQAQRHVQAPLLAAREVPDALVGLVSQPNRLDGGDDVGRALEVAREHRNGLAHAVHRIKLALLEHESDLVAPRPGGVRRVDTQHRHPTAVA